MAKPKEQSKLRIVSLGGVDEIGKNMTVFEYEDDIVVVDCGSIFPKEDLLGVDLVIPDVSYLVEKKKNVRGYLFTHGHEDHIGATPYILRQVPAPLYGTKLTLLWWISSSRSTAFPTFLCGWCSPGTRCSWASSPASLSM